MAMNKRPLTQRESIVWTLVLAAMMMSGLVFAAASPVDWVVRFSVVASIAVYLFGVGAVLIFERRSPEHAYNLLRVTIPSSVAMLILALTIYGIARHPQLLLHLR